MITPRSLCLAALLPVLTGCEIFAVDGDGQVTEVTPSVAPFTEVEAASSLDVEIRQGHSSSVRIRLDRNLVDRVSTRVEGGRLIIDEDGSFSTHVRGPQVIVTTPELSRAVLDGSGQVTIDTWNGEGPIVLVLSGSGDLAFEGDAPEVRAELGGSGDVRLRGRADRVDLGIAGSGDLDARDLAASRALLRLSGSGDLAANVHGPVDVDLSGSGDVEIFGTPRIGRESRTGSGDVVIRR